MKNFLKKFNNITLKLANIIIVLTCIILPIIIFVSVVMRYVLHLNFDGLSEIVVILCAWLYFLGSAVATYGNEQISASIIDLFVKKGKSMALVEIIRHIFSAILYVIVFKLALDNVIWMGQYDPRTAMLRLPQMLTYIPIAICFLLCIVYSIMHIVKSCHEYKNIKENGDESITTGGETNG